VVQGRQGASFHRCRQTVIFVAGPLEIAPAHRRGAQADDELVAALSEARDLEAAGRFVSFIGTKPLPLSSQYQLNPWSVFQREACPRLDRDGRRFASRKRVK